MNCPVCEDSRMREVEKDGVLIDICPSCKGVWLDRGELDKLMEGVREMRQQFDDWYDDRPHEDKNQRRYHDDDYDRRAYDRKPRRKKSVLDVLGDLFD